MIFLGPLVLLVEAAGRKPLGLMVASIDTNPGCELDICQILVVHKHGLPCLHPLHQTFPGDFLAILSILVVAVSTVRNITGKSPELTDCQIPMFLSSSQTELSAGQHQRRLHMLDSMGCLSPKLHSPTFGSHHQCRSQQHAS